MKNLAIDIETYSETDLTKSGVYKYVQDPAFEIMLFAYKVDDEPVQIVDLVEFEDVSNEIMDALHSPNVLKTAFNANFEITALNRYFNLNLDKSQWECTMVKSAMLGLPMSLDQVSKVLKLAEGKDAKGKALIKYFSMPCKPSKSNGGRTRNLPIHDEEKWQQFKDYCVQDVVVEQSIRNKISFFQIPPTEKKLWQLDQEINDRGVLLDPVLVKNAISLDTTYRAKLTKEISEITNLENPNSPSQLKEWLSEETGTEVTSLTKEAVPVLLELTDSDTVTRALEIRQEMSKTSVKKYEAMMNCICADNRARGLLQFGGASRTMRWAGRLIQVQNLPQNHLDDLDLARKLVLVNDLPLLELLFGNVPDTLSQLIRTAFVAPEGSRFIVADFSAIEARVIAWLAGERWRQEVFKSHGWIYEASASQMFKVPIDSIVYIDENGEKAKGENYHLRKKGKVAELACGYQGGVNALIQMGALKMGVPEEDLPGIIAAWRKANPAIVRLWNTVEKAAISAVEGNPTTIAHDIDFFVNNGMLLAKLPSKRMLCYQKPILLPNKFGGVSLAYQGMNQTTRQWQRQDTYGGKLVENLVQAIARDCLADAMLRLDAAGYKIVIHVHDEAVLEVPNGTGSLEEVLSIMSQPISWAKGLLLTADGYETNYYKKD